MSLGICVYLHSSAARFRNVSSSVGGRSILSGIDLSVEQAETVVLLGRSGSGKTTLRVSLDVAKCLLGSAFTCVHRRPDPGSDCELPGETPH